MKNLFRIAIMTICLFITAIFTSACGNGKTTPPNYPYWLLTQNNQQNNEQHNNNENNQQDNNNNEEEPVNTTEVNLTLTDSLNAEQIATADIYYSVDSTAKSSDEDQEILKAIPNADDKTKITISINSTTENTKIKAVITYDSEGKCLDYFSSYNGVSAENETFNINFENENGDFANGTGTEDDPYLISQPRHFVNINKKDDQGNYLYLDKNFKQTEDLDFSHLTGLKINKADNDKDITIESKNENAPLHNNGKGFISIGEFNEDNYQNSFQGNYNGNKKTIDGITIVNPQKTYIGLFTGLYNGIIQNLTIGENSIIFIDKNDENYSNFIYIGGLVSNTKNSTLEYCTNNAKIIIKNIENGYDSSIAGIISEGTNVQIKNCTNNGAIIVDNCKFYPVVVNGIVGYIESYGSNEQNKIDNCTNNGNITVTNNKNISTSYLYLSTSGIISDTYNEYNNNIEITNCTNNGNIIVKNNSNLILKSAGIIAKASNANITTCTNKGNIKITENTVTSNELECKIYAYGVAYIEILDSTQIANDCTNNRTIIATVTDNPNYEINTGEIANNL